MTAPFADEQLLERGEVVCSVAMVGARLPGSARVIAALKSGKIWGAIENTREADQRSLRGAPLGGRCLAGSQGSDLRGSQE